MKRKFVLLIFLGFPLFSEAALLSYKFSGYAEDLSSGEEYYLTIDFFMDNESWLWSDMEVEFLGNKWTPTSNNNFLISIWSTMPEVQPTYWFDWMPELASGQNVINFHGRPEWKLYHNNGRVSDDPLSYLDRSYFNSQLLSLNDGRWFGLSGGFQKVVDVYESSSFFMFMFGVGLIVIFNVLRGMGAYPTPGIDSGGKFT